MKDFYLDKANNEIKVKDRFYEKAKVIFKTDTPTKSQRDSVKWSEFAVCYGMNRENFKSQLNPDEALSDIDASALLEFYHANTNIGKSR